MMKRLAICVGLWSMLLIWGGVAHAGVLTVQGGGADFESVTAAISAAQDGDTVRILDSQTYSEDYPIIQSGFIGVSNLTIEAAEGQTPVLDHIVRGRGSNRPFTLVKAEE